MPLLVPIAERSLEQTTPRKISQVSLPSLVTVVRIFSLFTASIKRQGKQLLQELGADPALYEKIPTADLEEDKPGLADEVALGVTYEEIDDYLEGKTISPEAQSTIENWWHKGQHKRHLPITVFDDFWE